MSFIESELRKKVKKREYDEIPEEIRFKIEMDRLIYGNGYAEKDKDGNWKYLPASNVIITQRGTERPNIEVLR